MRAASPLMSLGVLRDAVSEFVHHFQTAARMIGRLMTARSLHALAANAAVIPKGLWISRIAREWCADHIHAYWASSPASAALIAAECSGIPWSFTAHRHDLARDNLLSEKTRHAAFVRVISESGLRMLRAAAPAVARIFDAISAAGGITAKAGNTAVLTHRDRPQDPETIPLAYTRTVCQSPIFR